jgi:glycosyltransferase involved in cell wall biosynthesis
VSLKISIITVCFNSAETIGRTLHSVRDQTYKNIEHIIIDGGSTDNTLHIIESDGSHVAKIISESDAGIYDAMNKGISLASGDLVGFINSDDFYAYSGVLMDVATLFERTGADSCFGDLCYVSQTDSKRVIRYWQAKNFIPKSFESGWCPPHPTFFVRRSIYERLGGFDLGFKIAADFELMARYLEVARISTFYITKVLVNMRLGGTTNKNISNILMQNIEIRKALIKNGLKFSFLKFFVTKIISRCFQFLIRPAHYFLTKLISILFGYENFNYWGEWFCRAKFNSRISSSRFQGCCCCSRSL